MNIRDLINIVDEAPGDFSRYRQMGQHPTELVGHVAKKILGRDSNTASQVKPKSAKDRFGDTTEIKNILELVLAGKPLDSRSIQVLKQFKDKL